MSVCFCFFLGCLLLLLPGSATALDLSGQASVEGILFTSNAAWDGQKNSSASAAGKFEFYHELSEGLRFTAEGFYRLDSADSERSHGDVRTSELSYFNDHYEAGLGIGKVFWGATEFVHLVDIINQTDQVESPDGEEKLGQPMVHLSVPADWWLAEFFILPWFRERTFPGVNGRFRTMIPVANEMARYESSRENKHIDFALRYSASLNYFDGGLYFFRGTARDPVLLLNLEDTGNPVLFPYYQQINQYGLDLQGVFSSWLLKVEAYYRTGQSRSYAATTFGFEYTFTAVADSMMDVGVIGEYVYDDRDDGWLPTIYENDIMGGIRLALNDMDDSTILLGVIRDLESGSTIIGLESSRRIGETLRINIDASFFLDMDCHDPAFSMARDDSIKLELVWYW